MKKQMMFTISALLILLISVSCQGTATPTEEVLEPTQEPTVEPSPTLEPTAIPLEEPTATTAPTEAPVIELVPQEAILNITWQWADWLQNSPEAYAVVPVPENYTLRWSRSLKITRLRSWPITPSSSRRIAIRVAAFMPRMDLAWC